MYNAVQSMQYSVLFFKITRCRYTSTKDHISCLHVHFIYICIYIYKEFKNSTTLSITFFDLEIRALFESDTDSLKTLRMPLWGSRV